MTSERQELRPLMESVAVLYVDEKRCSGCGVCVDACPTGAISVQDGTATISRALCNRCEACADLCPQGAILSVTEGSLVPRQSEVRELRRQERSGGEATTARVAPAVGATLLLLGRELVPRVATYVLDLVDRHLSQGPGEQTGESRLASGSGSASQGTRRRRHRRGS